MKISKIRAMQPAVFKAKTTVLAPESLLNSEDKKYFEQLGSKAGKDSDIIEIKIGDLVKDEKNPQTYCYQYSIKKETDIGYMQTNLIIPYIKDGQIIENSSPYNYLSRYFDRLLNNS